MPTVALDTLATLLADRWADARRESPALRLTLPHLVLAAAGPLGSFQAAVGMGRRSQQLSPAALGIVGDGPSATCSYYQHAETLTAGLRGARAASHDLLAAWDLAAAQFDPGSEEVASGQDGDGRPWMPMLGGLNPALPLDPDYVQLGAAGPHGPGSQLLLLAVAGEVGYQRLRVDRSVLTAHTMLAPEHLDTAAQTLEHTGWVGWENWAAEDGTFPRILWVTAERQHAVFRGLGATCRR